MIPSLHPSGQQFVNTLDRIGARMERAQRQISTGLSVERVSDDPDRVGTLLTVRARLDAARQVGSDLSRIKAEVDSGEQALQHAVELFEKIRTIAAQGNSSIQTAESRGLLALDVESVLDQLVGLAGTVVEGRYIFSGDTDQQPPYAIDFTQTPPVSAYQGSASTRVTRHPSGSTFAVARTAQEIFDSADPATNVFATITALRDALLANDDATIQSAADALRPVGGHLNIQLAYYGSVQNKIAEAVAYGEDLQFQIQAQIGSLQDADLTTAILELNQAQTQQQAALASRAQLPRATLFDYLG
jgi:flagellar hook-associated protein 3 FlgL